MFRLIYKIIIHGIIKRYFNTMRTTSNPESPNLKSNIDLSESINRDDNNSTCDSSRRIECRDDNEEQVLQHGSHQEESEEQLYSIDTLKQEGLDFMVPSIGEMAENRSSMARTTTTTPKLQRTDSIGIINLVPFSINNSFDDSLHSTGKRQREHDEFSYDTLSCESSGDESESSGPFEYGNGSFFGESDTVNVSRGKEQFLKRGMGPGTERDVQLQNTGDPIELGIRETGDDGGFSKSTIPDRSISTDGGSVQNPSSETTLQKDEKLPEYTTPIQSTKPKSRRLSFKRQVIQKKRKFESEPDLLIDKTFNKSKRIAHENMDDEHDKSDNYYQRYHKIDLNIKKLQGNLLHELDECGSKYVSEISPELISSYERKNRSCKAILTISGFPVYIEEWDKLAKRIEQVFLDFKLGINELHVFQNNVNENDKWLQTHYNTLGLCHHIFNYQEGQSLEDLQFLINDTISQQHRELHKQFSNSLKKFKHKTNFIPPFLHLSHKSQNP